MPPPPPPPPDLLALSRGRAGAGAWLHAALFTLLAWAAVVCTGLGGTVGVATQSLANKLAASAQHWQRQGGTSPALRAVRRDEAAATSVQQVAEDLQALARDAPDETLPTGEVGLRTETRRADRPPLSTTELHLKPQRRAHLSRAPPVLA